MMTFTVLRVPDLESGGYTVTVPGMPGCITHGDTIDEALEMAREAIAVYLQGEDVEQFLKVSNGVQVVVASVLIDEPG